MISYQHIRSVTYYIDSSRDPDQRLGYYTDANSEPPGRWWSPAGWQAVDGAEVSPRALERLASYRDTAAGRTLPGQRAADARAATDYSFSTPKAFSALWAVSDEDGRSRLEEAVMASVRDSLTLVHEQRLIEARRRVGGRNGEIVREAVEAPVAALYLHHTSREGDPQLHVHALLMNAAMRADGTVGAVNNEKMLERRQLLDAVYTRGLARRLEAMGVQIEPDPEHGFRIAGQPDDLIERWSSRRRQIVAAAAERGIETRDDAAQAQVLALGTRQRKADVQDRAALEERWLDDRYGRDRDLLMDAIGEAAGDGRAHDPEWARLDRPPVRRSPGRNLAAQQEALSAAVERMEAERSWWRRDQLGAVTIRLGTGRTDGGNEAVLIDRMIADGRLVEVESDGQRLMTTPHVLRQEQDIQRITHERRLERAFFSQAAQQAALADRRLSDEQKSAVEAMLTGGGVVAVEGGAGVGKTTASAGIKRACEADGKRLLVASPEWRAAGVLAGELDTDERFSVDRIINQIASGRLVPDADTVILIDEAGKMHRDQAAELLRLTEKSGAKIVMMGDTRQMAAVRPGDPLDLIVRANPAAEIRQIRRQRVDWQREASMAAQAGDMSAMIGAYAERGHVRIEATRAEAVAEIAKACCNDGGDAVALAATNRDVTALNTAIRDRAREIGLVTGPEVTIEAIPRGKNAKAVPLALATGDRLIAGAALEIGGERVENGTIFSRVEVDGDRIAMTTDAGRTYETTAGDLVRAGRQGKPPSLQHAFALTDMSSQGSTWSRTLWMPTVETARAAYVAATRHRDDLQVFIAREAVKDFADGEIGVGRRAGMVEGERADQRTDADLIAQMAQSLARRDDPRNALDVFPPPLAGPEREPEPVQSRIVGRLVSRTDPSRDAAREAVWEHARARALSLRAAAGAPPLGPQPAAHGGPSARQPEPPVPVPIQQPQPARRRHRPAREPDGPAMEM